MVVKIMPGRTMDVEPPDEPALAAIIDLLVNSLLTDGSFHKQWFTEKALELLGVNIEELTELLRDDDLSKCYEFERGIAP